MITLTPAKLSKFIPGKKWTIGLAVGALAVAGTAIAAQAGHGRADIDGDGMVTRAESQALATQRFAMLDVNKDGKLDAADRAVRSQAMFSRMDSDKNGQLSLAEFESARLQRIQARSEGGPQNDGPGMWRGRLEGREGGRHGGMDHGGSHRQAMMMQADSDHNGAISQAEFTARAQQRFDQVDTDKNGQITNAERRAARMAMRNMWQSGESPATPTAGPATPQ